MSASVGDSFTNNGRFVATRARRTTSESAVKSAPNSMPPAFTLGQLTLISYPSSAPGESLSTAASNSAMTSANSSTPKPTMFAILRVRGNAVASHGR